MGVKPEPHELPAAIQERSRSPREDDTAVPSAGERNPARRRGRLSAAAILLGGLALTAALAWVSQAQYVHNEARLLRLRVRDAGSLLTEAAAGEQTPLAASAALADGTGGSVAAFHRFAAPLVGSGPSQFVSVSLWRAGAVSRPVAVVGSQPQLQTTTGVASGLFTRVRRTGQLGVVGLLHTGRPALGYAEAIAGLPNGYVVYGERLLPADRRSRYEASSQFAGLNYAIYLGSRQRPDDLLVADVKHLPLTGTHAAQPLPFGTNTLTLVMSTRASLEGALPENLPWIIAVAGVLLSIGAASLAFVLVARRQDAELMAVQLGRAAEENRRLYAEQRGIAQTLQHALLPGELARTAGTETCGIYRAAERGADIGGDWYDVVALGPRRMLAVVGDVSGHGLSAATTMAQLRFAIRAYAVECGDPADILTRLTTLHDLDTTGQLATILCAMFDTERREITLTSAGHPPPVLVSDGVARVMLTEVGVPVGVRPTQAYRSRTLSGIDSGTLISFTDGLVERRGEDLDAGLERLRQAAGRADASLSALIARLLDEVPLGPRTDDIAILGVRWAW